MDYIRKVMEGLEHFDGRTPFRISLSNIVLDVLVQPFLHRDLLLVIYVPLGGYFPISFGYDYSCYTFKWPLQKF